MNRSHCLTTLATLVLGYGASPAAAIRGADFNGDGFNDLVIGVPDENTNGPNNSKGVVQVLYGSVGGLSAGGDQLWSQDSANVLEQTEYGDDFGAAIAWGDFNADDFDDLAIGAPGESLGTTPRAGTVNVLYGSPDGLTSIGNQLWNHAIAGLSGDLTTDGRFGWILAAGDFNGDLRDDLVIGAKNAAGIVLPLNAGLLHVLYGTDAGLSATGEQLWHQDTDGIEGVAEVNDQWGTASLQGLGKPVTADFNGDGFDDLAVAGRDSVDGAVKAGAVSILYGSATGLIVDGNQLFHQNTSGIPSIAEPDDLFGNALAAADFDGDGFADLAIGAAQESSDGLNDSGMVHVLYGTDSGLSTAGNQVWHQDKPSVRENRNAMDHFGWSLAAGDFDGDGHDDLAVGVPNEDTAGAVSVLYGSATGLNANGDQIWTQNSSGIKNQSNQGDGFGYAVTASDYDGDGKDDLVVGAPFEDINWGESVGLIHVIYGSGDGLDQYLDQIWHQNSTGIEESIQSEDRFGLIL